MGRSQAWIDRAPTQPAHSTPALTPHAIDSLTVSDDMDGEWEAPTLRRGRAVKRRYDATHASLLSPSALAPLSACELAAPRDGETTLRCASSAYALRLRHAPFAVHLIQTRDGATAVSLNGRNKLLFTPFSQGVGSETAEAPPPSQPPHTFNSFTDPMPYGASSVGVDVAFPHATHAYGIPAHTPPNPPPGSARLRPAPHGSHSPSSSARLPTAHTPPNWHPIGTQLAPNWHPIGTPAHPPPGSSRLVT
jgi:hypothetical protein